MHANHSVIERSRFWPKKAVEAQFLLIGSAAVVHMLEWSKFCDGPPVLTA